MCPMPVGRMAFTKPNSLDSPRVCTLRPKRRVYRSIASSMSFTTTDSSMTSPSMRCPPSLQVKGIAGPLGRYAREHITGSVDAALPTRPVGVAQLELLELAGGRAHERISQLDRRRTLVVRHAAPAMLGQLPLGARGAGAQHHQRLDGLAPFLVGHADHRDLGDGGMLEETVLHLDRRDVFAARDDHVLLAIGDGDVG